MQTQAKHSRDCHIFRQYYLHIILSLPSDTILIPACISVVSLFLLKYIFSNLRAEGLNLLRFMELMRLKLLLCSLHAAKPLRSPPSSQKSSKPASQRRLLPSLWEHNIFWYAAMKENLSPRSVRETERFPSHLTLAVFSNYHFIHIMLFIRLGKNRCNQDQNLVLIKFLHPRETGFVVPAD